MSGGVWALGGGTPPLPCLGPACTVPGVRRFFIPPPWPTGGRIDFPDDEAHHARVVLRLGAGERVELLDGVGTAAEAELHPAGKQALTGQILSRRQVSPSLAQGLRVVAAPPKGARAEDMLRMLAELGVGSYAPLSCARAVRPGQAERARRVVQEACKQSGRTWLMSVDPAVGISDLAADEGQLILLDPDGDPALPGVPGPTTLVIGPEGGLTDEERELLPRGTTRVRLAPYILRIETAAVAAAATWIAAWEQHAT